MCFTWKAKAVGSLFFLLFLFSMVSTAQSVENPAYEKKISIDLHRVSLENALDQIARRSNISFVYSASVFDVKRTISFTAHNLSLVEVLKELAHITNLSFRPEGDHIVIKRPAENGSTKPKGERKVANQLLAMPENTVDAVLASLSTKTFYAPSQTSVNDLTPYQLDKDSMRLRRTARMIAEIQQALSQSVARQNMKNRTKPEWFISTGVFLNDYSLGGIEFKAGHRHFFGVVNASRTGESDYRVGYGAGTSISLSNRWDLQAIYTLAKITRTEDFGIFKNAVELDSWHHQVKLVAQYFPSRRIAIHAGLAFNILNTRYQFFGVDVPADIPLEYREVQPAHREVRLSLSQTLQSSGTIRTPYTISNTYSEENYLNTQTWIGFDAGISYRINFFSHR